MKKTYLLLVFLMGAISSNSQSYIGFLTDNYSGVHGVINNPASIADSRFKADINLIGISSLIGNDFFGFNINDDFLDDKYEIENEAKRYPDDDNNAFGNIDILGPSFMFNLNEKSAIAVFTRARAFYSVNGVNGNNVNIVEDGFDENENFNINVGNTYVSTNIWGEIGLSYARILFEKNQHFLKGGISLKYLMGLGNAYGTTNNVTVDYDSAATLGTEIGTVTSTGDVLYGYSENFENIEDIEDADDLEVSANGFGLDLGFIYEWRPEVDKHTYKDKDGNTSYYRDVNKYKVKLELSVTDIGSINYDGDEERYDANNTISQSSFENIDETDDIETLYGLQSTGKAEKAVLPAALHFNADWNINQKFYLNLNTDLSLTSKEDANRSSIANMLTLTPRFERKWFTLQMPLSIQQYSDFQWGTGLRAGPLYIGSGSILTVLINNDDVKAADVYLGLKVPIYHI